MFSYLATEIQGDNCFIMLTHLAWPAAPTPMNFFWFKKKYMLIVRKLEYSKKKKKKEM